jgi:hypothetical protein
MRLAVYVAHTERRGLYSEFFWEKLMSRDHLEDPDVDRSIILQRILRKITQNSIEVDAETKESTRKTKEELDGRYKEDHERKKPK